MKKKNFIIAILLLMALSLGCFTPFVSVQAAKKNAVSKKWAGAYMKIIEKINKEDSEQGISCTYDLIYFNKDNIPELVLGPDGYWVSMYTYDEKTDKVYQIINQWGYGMGSGGYEYFPKKNFLLYYDNDYAGAVQHVYCGMMKKHEIVDRNSKELKMLYFNDKNANGVPDAGEDYTDKPSYYYGSKKITKKKFNSYIASGKRKMIIGSMSFEKMKKKLIAKGA